MDTLTGSTMNATPFIMMAYSVGALGLLGFAHWSMLQRLRLRAQLAVVKKT
jgi:hypothetical protein